jgi:hypothetical protein
VSDIRILVIDGADDFVYEIEADEADALLDRLRAAMHDGDVVEVPVEGGVVLVNGRTVTSVALVEDIDDEDYED